MFEYTPDARGRDHRGRGRRPRSAFGRCSAARLLRISCGILDGTVRSVPESRRCRERPGADQPGDAVMETACAPTARFVAYADGAPMILRDIEDLHDADLENELADRLTEASGTP